MRPNVRAYSHQGHGPRADQTGRIHISDFRYPEYSLLQTAAGPYIWVISGLFAANLKMSAFGGILLQNSVLFGFAMFAFTISGRFPSHFRPMPVRDFPFGWLFPCLAWISGCFWDWRWSADVSGQLSQVLRGCGEEHLITGAAQSA